MNQQKITQLVETYCQMGCTSVYAIIETLESGMHVEGTEDLNDKERLTLTHELKAIMSVYQNKES